MDLESLQTGLAGLGLSDIHYFATTGSTNSDAADMLRTGGVDRTLLVADEQTRGRGRAGRGWHTPPGTALAFSLLLRFDDDSPPPALPTYAGLGALAVSTALESLGLQPQIKWPNDVLLGGRKMTGILPEAYWQGDRLQAVVLGIGLNARAGARPPADDKGMPATYLDAHTDRHQDRVALLAVILEQLFAWQRRQGQPEFMSAWEDRLAYRSERVEIQSGQEWLQGVLEGLDAEGALRIRLDSGQINVFQAGDLRLRPLR
jgi:BirA family biotin operon repressor/biotin-[acetyl-CoA-carboxylase] ligase